MIIPDLAQRRDTETYYNLLPCPCNLAFWICAWLAKRLHLIDETCGFWNLKSESKMMAFRWLREIGKAFGILTKWFILIATQRVKMTLDMVDTGRGENCQCSRITIFHDIEVPHWPIAKHKLSQWNWFGNNNCQRILFLLKNKNHDLRDIAAKKKWKPMFSIWRKFSSQTKLRFSETVWSVQTLQTFGQKMKKKAWEKCFESLMMKQMIK